MKNRLLNSIIAITLAQIVLFASTGFVLNFHLCENHIQSFSLFGKAALCNNMPCDISTTNEGIKMKKSCCSSKQIKSVAKQFHKPQSVAINKLNFAVNFILQNKIAILNPILKNDYFIGYSPPLQTFNLNNLYQVYRI